MSIMFQKVLWLNLNKIKMIDWRDSWMGTDYDQLKAALKEPFIKCQTFFFTVWFRGKEAPNFDQWAGKSLSIS